MIDRAAAAVLVAALAGCGNYSTEDLRFLAALPTRADLAVAVPSEGTPGAATACGSLGRADVWLWAKPTSDALNRGAGFVIGLIDVVRRVPPSAREKDLRRWGPFPDEKHSGVEIQVVLQRTYPAGEDHPPVHLYAFQARRAGAFRDVIAGSFEGASASRGRGSVVLSFDTIWDLGINEDASTARGTMQIAYDRASDPVTIDLQLTSEGLGIVPLFQYGFAGYRDGRGAFDYAFRNAAGDLLEVRTSFDAAGAGRDSAAYTPAGQPAAVGSFRECWDGAACLTYVDDPANLSCPVASWPCSGGSLLACPAVPAPPF